MFGMKRRDFGLAFALLWIAVATMAATWYGLQYFSQQLLKELAEEEALRWGSIVSSNLSDPEATFAYGRISAEDQQLIVTIAEAGDVFRYRFYDQGGVTVLASRLEDLGVQNTAPYFVEEVMQGRTFVTIEEQDAVRGIQTGAEKIIGVGAEVLRTIGGEYGATVARAYVPVLENGRFKGAIEVHLDASRVATYLDDVLKTDAAIGAFVLILLISGLTGFILYTNVTERNTQLHTMKRAHESMSRAEDEVLRLNNKLEQRVLERTAELEKANQLANEAAEGMKRLNEDLEGRVQERTEQMSKANEQLYRLNESMTRLNESLEQRVAERTAEIERANENIKQLNEDLERRVEERTAELQKTQAELVRSERLATLGQLTATVSHELRNPLGAIRTAIYLVRGRTEGQGLGVESALERADRSITRCDNIINELLDFTRSTPLAPETARFDDWLHSVLSEQNLPANVAFNNQLGAEGVEIAFDQERFRRVIINVFSNACEAMTEAVESGEINHQPELTVHTRAPTGGRLEVVFHDNGPGIPQEVLEKIFEPLYSTKSFGVGLGLPTVRQIMEQHGGGIEITSEKGHGTDVLVWLPLDNAEERAA
jgi:signal transduction histidine kinase